MPVEAYPLGQLAKLEGDAERIQRAEQLGFSAVWLRDVPFNVLVHTTGRFGCYNKSGETSPSSPATVDRTRVRYTGTS